MNDSEKNFICLSIVILCFCIGSCHYYIFVYSEEIKGLTISFEERLFNEKKFDYFKGVYLSFFVCGSICLLFWLEPELLEKSIIKEIKKRIKG